ncbi:MAG: hypothetical protein GF346_10610 [Candidatus Eisenbacteria bacterium]|nr:hypothetical protein [Candidatus Latescibacterota bacterium]MBD3302888.1 hypothetical protein [Candidatus Eisenbacteria bacterium]
MRAFDEPHHGRALDRAFDETEPTVETTVSEGDRVAVRFQVHGLHRGEYLGIAATARRVEFMGMTLYRLSGGRIAGSSFPPSAAAIIPSVRGTSVLNVRDRGESVRGRG